MSFQLITDILKTSNSPLLKRAMFNGNRALTSILLVLQLGLLIFSMLYSSSIFFFLCLKSLVVIGILIWLIEKGKMTKWLLYGTLLLLPGIWGVIIGSSFENPGVRSELSVYLLAPICFLVAFRHTGLSFLKSVIPVLKMACGINLMIFFFLYFSEGGKIYTYLQHYTGFFIQHPEGFTKVNTQQATLLIFLLPVIFIHFFFKKNAINFMLVTGSVLMALLIDRKAMLIMLCVLFFSLFLYSVYQRRSLVHTLLLMAPLIVAFSIFTTISNVTHKLFFDDVFNSFPSSSLVKDVDSAEKVANSADERNPGLQGYILYSSPANICSNENVIKLSKTSDKVGAIIRRNQISILSREILRSPWLGHGLGYIIPQCVRAEQQPWRFEMTYLGMAMDIGLLGLLIYCIVYVRWTFGAIRANLDSSVSIPLLGGSLFFLICAASNPYIMAVEYLWIFFIPYLLVQIQCEDLPARQMQYQ